MGWTLRQSSPDSAIIGRCGGEEFLIVDTLRAKEAQAVSTRVCAAIEATPHAVTASIGAALASSTDIASHTDETNPNVYIDQLIEFADRAMYRAKREGGNRVRYHQISPAGTS